MSIPRGPPRPARWRGGGRPSTSSSTGNRGDCAAHAALKRSLERPASADLDQLDGLAARPFDHDGTRLAESVLLLEESDALAAQLGGPGVQIGHAQRDVVVELPARAGQRLVALTHVPR